MTTLQKVIKYLAIAFALFLVITIIGGIIGAIGLFGGFFVSDAVSDDMTTYQITGEIRDLKIEINAASLCIKEGDAFSVESNLKNLVVDQKDEQLVIKDTNKRFGKYENPILTVYIPEGTQFDIIELTTGAGRLSADSLFARAIDFELGAGEVSIESLTATSSADIEGGAGRITISGGALNNLDMDMGVGKLELTSALGGSSKLDLGIGTTDITLLGSKDNYSLDIEKGLGSISVDGDKVSDYGSFGNGNSKLEIHGGIGAINVSFEEQKAE